MRPVLIAVACCIYGAAIDSPRDGVRVMQTQDYPRSATVPFTLDHNRIIVDVQLPQPDGTTMSVPVWVDNGNPDLWVVESAAKAMGLEVSGELREEFGLRMASTPASKKVLLGGMPIDFSGAKRPKVRTGRSAILPGLSAALNLPSTVLRNYDVVIDYPHRKLTIAQPGTVQFTGRRAKIHLNDENGLIQVDSAISGQGGNLALDVGASFSFLASDLFEKLRENHARWPHVTGAIGEANLWGLPDEPKWELLRVAELQYGPVVLKQVGVASFAKENLEWFEKRAGFPTLGLIGGNALLGYRLGIDYENRALYFEHGGPDPIPEIDVIGLVLRPEPEGRYTVIGVADFEGKPSIADVKPGDVLVAVGKASVLGRTMGQVWTLLRGRPSETRKLILDRGGKQFKVKATVRRFLASPRDPVSNCKR